MLGGQGFFRGSSILTSGTAGTGKTTLAAHFIDAACRRGEQALYFAFEESPSQLFRNMRSIGIDLDRWVKKGLLHVHAARPTTFGIEMHLVQIYRVLLEHQPKAVVLDPLSSLNSAGAKQEVQGMVLRIIDHLKSIGATAFFTTLTSGSEPLETTGVNVSSLVDTWLLLRDVEADGERNRIIYVLKSRGMAHSNQLREFKLTGHGAELLPAYLGPSGVLTGSARIKQEAKELEMDAREHARSKQTELALTRKLRALEAEIATLEAEKAAHEVELKSLFADHELSRAAVIEQRAAMAASRKVKEPAQSSRTNGRGSRL